jgi:hypothetical protein
VFFSSQNIDFPFYLKRLGAFFLSLSFHALSLEDMGVLMIFEEKITSSKTSFQMASIDTSLNKAQHKQELLCG